MATLTKEQFEKQYGKGVIEEQEMTFAQDAVGDIAETGKNIFQSVKGAGQEVIGDIQKSQRGERSPIKAGFDVAGSVVGGISDVIGDVALGAGKLATTQSFEEKTAEFVGSNSEIVTGKHH